MKILKFAAGTLAALLLLALIARLSLAPLVGGAIEDWFDQQGITASIEDLGFELIDGRAALTGLSATAGDVQVLALGHAELAWSWSDLFDNRLTLQSIRIDGLDLNIERSDDGGMTIAGIDLSATAADGEADAATDPGEPIEWSLQLPGFEMNNTRLCYRGPQRLDYCNELDSLVWDGSLAFDLSDLGTDALPLRAEGQFRLTGFESRSNELQRVLAGFDSFAFDRITVDTSDSVSIGTITLEALKLFERATPDDGAYIEQIDSLQIRETRLEGGQLLTVAEIQVQGNATEFVKSEADRYEIDVWLAALGQAPEPAGEATGEAQKSGEDAAPAAGQEADAAEAAAEASRAADVPEQQPVGSFDFSVGKLVFESEKPLRYRDLSLAKSFAIGLSSTRLVVESLDSRQPEQPSDITYEAKLDGDSLLKVEGTATPLAPKISFDLAGEIRALDLRQLSPLAAANIGHTIKSGQLDADINLKAEQAIMDGKVELILYHFDLVALSEADAAAMDERFGFPLKTSLSLLKNRDGNIELEVPLSGDLENPDFGTGKIISRELSKAITSAVLTFYTPLGLLTAANMLLDLSGALEFEPVTFESGASELDAGEQTGLDKIATLMQERPGVQLRLCPHTNTADREALLPRTADMPAEELALEGEQLAALAELGEARLVAVEQYLTGKQIEPARLVHCNATHDEGEGLAGVEMSI